MPPQVPSTAAAQATYSSSSASSTTPDAPLPQQTDFADVPRATPLPPAKPPETLTLDSDTQSQDGDLYTLKGNVEVHYGDHTLYADTITYNKANAQLTLEGHVKLVGGENNEYLQASHGDYNLHNGTGHFYDVNGSIQPRVATAGPTNAKTTVVGASAPPDRTPYTNANPFLFWGREVAKTGPDDYTIYNGSVTSCLLPHPDWQLFSSRFTLSDGKAHAGRTTFKLLGLPLLFLPYVSHPTDTTQRQSGILIPVFGYSSASNHTGSKGITIGEQVYVVVSRSVDFTVGTIFYSLRGWSENGTVRYKGPGDDYLTGHFTALQDRGFYQPTQTGVDPVSGTPIIQNVYTNQGGQDVTVAFRYRLDPATRVVADGEYLSSYIYREAFTENFNQAVSSDITSTVFLAHQSNGHAMDIRIDRYEGQKVVPVADHTGEEVKIFHAPSLDFTGIDRGIPGTPFFYNVQASAAAMKRVQPNFVSPITGRIDVRPEISLPAAFGGWHLMASAAVRETAYTDSRKAPYGPNATPIDADAGLNRADFEFNFDIRPPAIERTFTVPARWHWLLGDQVRHTIEPEITYRDVRGAGNFLNVLRFDDVDLVSDTNELRYGVVQHLYFRPKKQKPLPGCPATTSASEPEEETPHATTDANGIPEAETTAPDSPTRTHVKRFDPCARRGPAPQQEWFSWELAQKTFFDRNFGGAVIDTRRNIFESTLNFSGIAFLTEPRAISPLISRMRFRTSSHADVEWDFDYDTGAKKFNSSNIFLDAHEGNWFGGFSYAKLNAPGRSYTENISSVTNTVTGLTSSATADFSQMRVLLGYGSPTRPGLALAGGAGIDLNAGDAQYTTLQAGYNWNCCGISIEYRQYNLGPVRDEGAYRFNFTLANIGSAGNLRRNEALF
ncbi:LPS assembly protein LptD [Granulicella sp. 5B5]|uniref:LPS-assembly protein LptD n=1 Tax=Granulicella sp. 5B5 TaxID=1617967 RepID=UPI0015F4D9EB|nr:LPS assembly protein LptD [Granulicella sp. 5B5]